MEERDRRRRRQRERERLADEAFFDGLLLGHYMWHDGAAGGHPDDRTHADEFASWENDTGDDNGWDFDDDVDGMDDWD